MNHRRSHAVSSLESLGLLVLALLCSAILGAARPPGDKLRVVTTLPDLLDVVREIGGDRVEATSIYKGRENTHALVAKPSHLVALSRADLFVQVGLSLETSCVPGLLEGCGNARIQPGKPGFVNASQGWKALDVPAQVSRKDGDVHPEGNPHMNLDPSAGRHFAARVLAGLCAVDPAGTEAYTARHAEYSKKLDAASERWARIGQAWKGRRFVVYHKEYDYLARTYAIEIQGSIEAQPGIPPTPNHVAQLVEAMRKAPGAVIVTAPWSNDDTVREIAERTGAKVVELPNLCGGLPGTETWIGMMDLVHDRLARAFGTASAER